MALQGSSTSEGDTAGANTYSNDGSFMEQFMKMQKEKSETKTEPVTSPLTTIMKPATIKRPAPTSLIQKRIKSLAAKRTASDNKGKVEPIVGSGGLNFDL